MATYKKTKPNKNNHDGGKTTSTTSEIFETLDVGANRTERWVLKNQKILIGIFSVVIVFSLGYMGYQRYIIKPLEEEARSYVINPRQKFNEAMKNTNATVRDSLLIQAIEGHDEDYGFLDIIENFGGTDTANLSYYRVGVSYFAIREYEKAISYLEQFKSNDFNLKPLSLLTIADAYVNLGQYAKALQHYDKLISSYEKNQFITPKALYKAAIVAVQLDKKTLALAYFKKIKLDFLESDEARDVDIYISKYEDLK